MLKKLLLAVAIISPFSIFFMPYEFGDFAKIAWYVLIFVMSLRPVSNIFPGVRFFKKLMVYRREFGIFVGMMLLAHFAGVLMVNNLPPWVIFQDKMYWNFSGFLVWGVLGLLVMLPVLLTSNNLSVRRLKTKWAWVQRLSYLLVLFGGLHLYFLGQDLGAIGIGIVAGLWIIAKIRKSIKSK